MKTRFDTTLLLAGAFCAALVTGCGDDAATHGSATSKETAKAAETAGKMADSKKAAESATKPAAGTPAKPAAPASVPAALGAASDAATEAAQAALDKIPTQDELDAAAAKAISSANEDAEFEKLAKEIEKGDGK